MYGGDEVSAIVIDVGSYSCKAGYAGDDTPKCVFPSVVGSIEQTGDTNEAKPEKEADSGSDPKNGSKPMDVDKAKTKRKFYLGQELEFRRDHMEVISPMKDGTVTDWEVVDNIWNHAFRRRLLINPEEHPMLIAEPSTNSGQQREKAVEVMFEKYKVPALFLAKNAVLTSFASGRATSLVVDWDTETLAQRVAKRTKTSTGDEPPASTSGAPELTDASPEPSPRRSPRLSPQREPITHFPLESAGVCIFTANITGLAGEERQQGGPSSAIPDTPPPSTTPPRDGSPARASSSELYRDDEEPASAGSGGPTSATGVAGKGESTSQQLDTDLPSTEHMDVDAVIEETARDAAAEANMVAAGEAAKNTATEAAKDAAAEAAKAAQEEAAKESAERAGRESSGHTSGIPAAGAPGATPATEPSTSEAPSSSKYLKVGDNLFVSMPGSASTGVPVEGEVFDEDVIFAAGLKIVNEPSTSSSGSEEEKLLQAMSNNIQKLQALYRTRKEKLDSRAAVVDAAEGDL